MDQHDERAAELIGAALAGDLSPAERAELDALCAERPDLRRELEELRRTAEAVSASGLSWTEAEPSAELGARIRAIPDVDGPDVDGPGVDGPRVESPVVNLVPGAPGSHGAVRSDRSVRRALTLLATAAVFLVVGVVGGRVVDDVLNAPPDGPPGTLGAVEQVTFPDLPDGGRVDAAVVAHTWGTETLLEVDGAPLGETFAVVVVGEDGTEYSSGAFLGAEQTVVCRMNAAVLREDVATVRIESADGTVLAASELVDTD